MLNGGLLTFAFGYCRKQAGIVQMPVTELASILQDPQLAAQHQFVDVREPAEEDIARIKQFQLFPLSK